MEASSEIEHSAVIPGVRRIFILMMICQYNIFDISMNVDVVAMAHLLVWVRFKQQHA